MIAKAKTAAAAINAVVVDSAVSFLIATAIATAIAIALATAIANAIDDAAVADLAANFLVDAAMNVEADAGIAIAIGDAFASSFAIIFLAEESMKDAEADVAIGSSAICWIRGCFNSDAKTKVRDRIDCSMDCLQRLRYFILEFL